jgi:Sulfotransferase family
MTPQLAYILSLPRSGSTVLSALLDKRKGVVSPPESSFPQVLGVISPTERKDPRWLAALYIGATFPPTPLSLEDAESCMVGTDKEILISLGKAVAIKLDRDPNQIKSIVWKTPRTVGMHTVPLSTDGKFIILRRNPHNVYESQFRVDFGKNNRNPWRFAIFRESYEHAFARLPRERVFQLEYDDFIGANDEGEWQSTRSSLDLAAENCSWLTEVTKDFHNTDPKKRARLDPQQLSTLETAMNLARPLRPLMGPIRSHFDHQSLGPIRERAKAVLDGGH